MTRDQWEEWWRENAGMPEFDDLTMLEAYLEHRKAELARVERLTEEVVAHLKGLSFPQAVAALRRAFPYRVLP